MVDSDSPWNPIPTNQVSGKSHRSPSPWAYSRPRRMIPHSDPENDSLDEVGLPEGGTERPARPALPTRMMTLPDDDQPDDANQVSQENGSTTTRARSNAR